MSYSKKAHANRVHKSINLDEDSSRNGSILSPFSEEPINVSGR
jgi:hypothetical protein